MRYIFLKKNNPITGFTIIELLVSIAIIGLMAAMVAVNFREGGSNGEVRMAAQKLASDIRQVQGYSLSLKEFSAISDYPMGGWGIYLRKNQPNDSFYYFYADYGDGSGGLFDHIYNTGELYRQIDLLNGITIDQITIDGTPRTSLFITFEPPNPDVWICRNASQCSSSSDGEKTEITLSNTRGDTASVFINAFGLVDVQN